MRYTIVTPTICRQSLVRLCESIDSQSQSDWEHLVVVDMPRDQLGRDQRQIISSIPARANRSFSYCSARHNNFGHTCRHQAWQHAKGDYILYVDDDDYLAHKDSLKTLDSVVEPWAVFPILRYGQTFLNLPPGISKTGTGMFIHKREIGRWHDSNSYEADGLFVEELRQKYAYQVLECAPVVVIPRTSCGVPNADSWFGNKMAGLVSRWLRFRSQVKTETVAGRAKSES
jgi:glycosyltransferase involved in cell wall biosynthesis